MLSILQSINVCKMTKCNVMRVLPVVKHSQELDDEQKGERQQKHQTQRLHPQGIWCQSSVRIVLWNIDAQNISANGLKEERCYNPQDINYEVQKHCLQNKENSSHLVYRVTGQER